MNVIFKAEGNFLTAPNQLCVFEHNGKKFHCNVDVLIEDYQGKQAGPVSVEETFIPNEKINAEYAMKTDTGKPVIIVRFDDGTHEVLDGNHRLFRAVQEGQQQILAHVVTEQELKKYLMDYEQ